MPSKYRTYIAFPTKEEQQKAFGKAKKKKQKSFTQYVLSLIKNDK